MQHKDGDTKTRVYHEQWRLDVLLVFKLKKQKNSDGLRVFVSPLHRDTYPIPHRKVSHITHGY